MIAAKITNKLKAKPAWLLILSVSLGAFVASAAGPQARPKPKLVPQQRFLMVIETSHPMKRCSKNLEKIAVDLVRSGFNGQLREGDTVGVWTYNETLYAGRFPLTQWAPGGASTIASQIGAFLHQQKFEKEPDFRPVQTALNAVARDSDFLTIILITTGESDITGTAYAQHINETYKTWIKEQKKAHMPFVTILRSRRGHFDGYSVTPSPFQVDVPPWSVDPQLVVMKTNEVLVATNSPPPVTALVFTGTNPVPSDGSTVTNSQVTPQTSAGTPSTNIAPASGTQVPVPAAAPVPDSSKLAAASLQTNPPTPPKKAESNVVSAASAPVKLAPPSGSALVSPTRAVSASKTQQVVYAREVRPSDPDGSSNAPVQTAAAVPRRSITQNKVVLGGTAAALLLILAAMRSRGRRRPPQRVSLITKSLEREDEW